ncbi:MAG: formimidoylglutamase [Bacteroidetes bacterium]|nr:formimidoylglutamase [Bacteroidota bacterium]
MEQFWNFLDPPDQSLIYKRKEIGDLRFGETVETRREKFGDMFKAVLVGFPYDEGATRNLGRAGSSAGPDEIRKAFYKLTPTKSAALPDAEFRIFDAGDIKKHFKLEEALTKLEGVVSLLFRYGYTPIVLGGSNDLSYADFHACESVRGRCGAINIDSHLDVRDYSSGINSGTPYRMLIDEKVLLGKDFVEYGTQEFANSREHLSFVRVIGAQVLTLTQIRSQKNADTFMQAYRTATLEAGSTYVSFDIDSVRSSDAPGVSAPTPSGLSAEEILECAYLAGSETKTAMIDICEVNPKFDVDGHTSKLAAMIIANFLAGLSNRD